VSQSIAEPVAKITSSTPVKSGNGAERIAETMTRSSFRAGAAEPTVKETVADVAESVSTAGTALQDLTKAYQDVAVRNAQTMTAAIQSLSAVKSMSEFIELEHRLITESVEAAFSDSNHIARLTAAVFASAIEPMKYWTNTLAR